MIIRRVLIFLAAWVVIGQTTVATSTCKEVRARMNSNCTLSADCNHLVCSGPLLNNMHGTLKFSVLRNCPPVQYSISLVGLWGEKYGDFEYTGDKQQLPIPNPQRLPLTLNLWTRHDGFTLSISVWLSTRSESIDVLPAVTIRSKSLCPLLSGVLVSVGLLMCCFVCFYIVFLRYLRKEDVKLRRRLGNTPFPFHPRMTAERPISGIPLSEWTGASPEEWNASRNLGARSRALLLDSLAALHALLVRERDPPELQEQAEEQPAQNPDAPPADAPSPPPTIQIQEEGSPPRGRPQAKGDNEGETVHVVESSLSPSPRTEQVSYRISDTKCAESEDDYPGPPLQSPDNHRYSSVPFVSSPFGSPFGTPGHFTAPRPTAQFSFMGSDDEGPGDAFIWGTPTHFATATPGRAAAPVELVIPDSPGLWRDTQRNNSSPLPYSSVLSSEPLVPDATYTSPPDLSSRSRAYLQPGGEGILTI